MRQDYAKVLDQYEAAKGAVAAARRPADMRAVTEALAEDQFTLATLAARRTGQPLPEQCAPCFFDPRHGPSVPDVPWAPPGDALRDVPACQADVIRVQEGCSAVGAHHPDRVRTQPYYNAGLAYGPWSGGYFGGGILLALMIGTIIGSFIGGGGRGDFGGGDW